MTIAVPVLNHRIAPRLCFARDILVFSAPGYGTLQGSEKIVSLEVQPTFLEFAKFLKEQGVEVVLCCGVNRQARYLLEAMGMEVVTGLTGDAREVAQAFLDDPERFRLACRRNLGLLGGGRARLRGRRGNGGRRGCGAALGRRGRGDLWKDGD